MPYVCQACSKEVLETRCPVCGRATVEGTLQHEQAYRKLAVALPLGSVGLGLITNLVVVAGNSYLSHLPRDMSGGMGMVFGFTLGPLVWGIAGLGVLAGVFGVINAGGSRMWKWAAAAVLGIFLSVLPFFW